MADGHGVAIPAQPKSVLGVGVYKMDYYHMDPTHRCPSLLTQEDAMSRRSEHSDERGVRLRLRLRGSKP